VASFVKFNTFVGDLGIKVHNLNGDTLKVFLTNSTPNVSTNTVKADLTDLSTANGYTAGGAAVTNAYSGSAGTGTLTGTDIVWTASGAVGPFRYAILYNDTPTSPADPLIGYWDYGSSISLANGETFTVDFGASILTLT
jgi:hypothetical protein